jgi:hypothetical protein
MQTYSFLDVKATLSGVGGSISLGSGAGCAEEGLSIEYTEETDSMMIGADGKIVHSLHAAKAGRVMIRLLKTSSVNSLLTAMYNLQRTSSLFHGNNIMVITNIATGDIYTCQQVAFARFPNNSYAKEANVIEWEFNVGQIDPTLGANLN